MKESLIKLVVCFSLGYLIFVLVGFSTLTCVHRWGYWRGVFIGPALVLVTLYAIKLVQVLIQRRRERLSYLLEQYGKMVAENARRRRCRHR